MEGKEIEGNSMEEMKRQRTNGRDIQEDRDRLNELPDCILLLIMNLMDTKFAVQTCVLSKRWKNLWKSLTNISFNTLYFNRLTKFDKFVSRVLSNRDSSISLRSLSLMRRCFIQPTLLNRVMEYGVLHHVQQLTMKISLKFRPDFDFVPHIFSCPSLTFLKISHNLYGYPLMDKLLIPKSLQLPALKSLHLEYVTFTTSDNHDAEPFSTCNVLHTLVLVGCCLHNDVEVLCISNSNLSILTIDIGYRAYKVDLSTPNLSSLTIMGWGNSQISSIRDLSVLEEVKIDSIFRPRTNTEFADICNLSWPQLFANVKIITLPSDLLKMILDDLSNCGSLRPCFVRLESLKVKLKSYATIYEEEVRRMAEYLHQNFPHASVDFIDW